jgi:hypothetical protein
LHGLPLRLLHLWILSSMTAQKIPGEDEQAVDAQRLLQDTEGDLRQQYPDVLIRTQLLPAETPAALLSAARNAELLVLGSQGLGAVRGYLLGSVALHTVAQSDPGPGAGVRGAGRNEGPPAQSGRVAVGVGLRTGYGGVLEFAFDAAATEPSLCSPSTPPAAAPR